MRLTRFRALDGTIYIIPNGDIRMIGNLSRGWARAVVDLTLPGATAADLDQVRSVIEAAAHRVATSAEFAPHCTEPPKLVGLQDADSATITVRVILLTVPSQRDALTRALREEAVAALARADLWPVPTAAARRPDGAPAARASRLGGRGDRRLRRRAPDLVALAHRWGARVRRLRRRLPHGVHGRFLSRPQRELRRRLVDEHAEAVEGRGAAARRLHQPGCRAGHVDEIGRHLTPWSSSGGTSHCRAGSMASRSVSVPPMPNGVALTTRSAARTASATASCSATSTVAPAGPASAAASRPVPAVRLTTVTSARPGAGQGQHDRPRRTARAGDQAAAAGRVEAGAAGQRGHEALAVRVGAEEHTVALHDAVHRIEPPGHVAALVDQRGHVRLVRHGHRQAGDVRASHVRQRRRRLSRRHLEGERAPRVAQARGRRRRSCAAAARASAPPGSR